jgi:hypothetical protein
VNPSQWPDLTTDAYTAEVIEAIIGSSGKFVLSSTIPSGYREVPIVLTARTPVVPRDNLSWMRGGRVWHQQAWLAQWCQTFRQAMLDAGRADEDWRCAGFLLMDESGWDCNGFNWNEGNRKIRPHGNPDLFRSRRAWIASADPFTGLWVLHDGDASNDFYGALNSLADDRREELRLFSTHTNYAGVLDGFRAGDLAGLVQARRLMYDGGYTPTHLPHDVAAQTEANGYWRVMTNHLGTDAARIFARDWDGSL